MSLKEFFAGRTMKGHLKQDFRNIELGRVTYVPERVSENKKDGDGVTIVAHFSAKFSAVSKRDGSKVKGGMMYASCTGGGVFMTVSGPA